MLLGIADTVRALAPFILPLTVAIGPFMILGGMLIAFFFRPKSADGKPSGYNRTGLIIAGIGAAVIVAGVLFIIGLIALPFLVRYLVGMNGQE